MIIELHLFSVKDLESSKNKLEKMIRDLTTELKTKDSTHQTLQDEYQALQAVSAAHETKLSSLERENDQLVSPLDNPRPFLLVHQLHSCK